MVLCVRPNIFIWNTKKIIWTCAQIISSLGFICEFRGKWRGGLEKNEGVSERNREHWEERLWGFYFSSKYKIILIWGN